MKLTVGEVRKIRDNLYSVTVNVVDDTDNVIATSVFRFNKNDSYWQENLKKAIQTWIYERKTRESEEITLKSTIETKLSEVVL